MSMLKDEFRRIDGKVLTIGRSPDNVYINLSTEVHTKEAFIGYGLFSVADLEQLNRHAEG